MDISAIHNPNINNKTFRGLWGPVTHSYSNDGNKDSINVYCNYYPFCNETAESIKQTIKSSLVPDKIYESRNNTATKVYNHWVIIHYYLPFSKEDFDDYEQGKTNNLTSKIISECIHELDLKA